MKVTTKSVAKEMGKDVRYVPISTTLLADANTPIELFKRLRKQSETCYLLESMENSNARGRYTFLGCNPVLEIQGKNDEIVVIKGDETQVIKQQPKEYLNHVLEDYKTKHVDGLPPFTGGLVGYFSYDYVRYSESVLSFPKKEEDDLPDFDLLLYQEVYAFDHVKDLIYLIVLADSSELDSSYEAAVQKLETMAEIVKRKENVVCKPGRCTAEFKLQFEKEQFEAMVEKCKFYIKEGDIFQVVPSNKLTAPYEGSLFNAYRHLRTTNPSPYMFFFATKNVEIMGASPETLVKLENGVVHTYPLAGSRPRGKSIEDDDALEAELLKDEKECAEHNMLVDLGRNDIGKVAKFGSVEVDAYMQVLKFSHIMHIGSSVKGLLDHDKTPLDVIESILPAGTLSGAPKIRAMQIIQELEGNHRDIYGGAIGYIDFNGNLDFCIGIRCAYLHNGVVTVRSGAGIVADSVPEKEFEECANKAKAVLLAIKEGEEVD